VSPTGCLVALEVTIVGTFLKVVITE